MMRGIIFDEVDIHGQICHSCLSQKVQIKIRCEDQSKLNYPTCTHHWRTDTKSNNVKTHDHTGGMVELRQGVMASMRQFCCKGLFAKLEGSFAISRMVWVEYEPLSIRLVKWQ